MKRLALVLALACVACSSDEGSQSSTSTIGTGPGEDAPAITATVDWKDRSVDVDGLDDYDVEFCDGDAPLLCVDEHGVIELLSRPEAGELQVGAQQWAEGFAASIENDRREGCDVRYALTLDPTAKARVAGRDGFRYSFTGRVGDEVMERVVGYGVVVRGDLHVLVMNALADDGCLPRESELPLTVAADLEPALAALAAGSTNLPSA